MIGLCPTSRLSMGSSRSWSPYNCTAITRACNYVVMTEPGIFEFWDMVILITVRY
uniref:Uncharacterized protein MANES_01G227500 n=1 Tax=Rhizophora mucronata TaxID=61149 RepID=A0A2P2M744_RHIMU